MARGIALLQRDPETVIVALGNRGEAAYMKKLALESGLPSNRLIVDGNSKTTIDNAYYAKQLCRQRALRPDFLVTSQYQVSRATATFKRVFGPDCPLRNSPSLSFTNTGRRLRETILRVLTPLLLLFRSGDDRALKRASDISWRLLFR